MLPTSESRSTVASSLADLHAMPLDEMSGRSAEVVDVVVQRILQTPAAPACAAFQSAI